MNAELLSLLNSAIQPNGRLMDALYGAAQSNLRTSIMRLITGNPKLPKSKCGANTVFEALCEIANTNPELSTAGRDSQLVTWIQSNRP